MGCWNKTCGLSRLHIKHGTEVYVFVLEQATDTTNRCYSTAFWRPVLLPFYSKYNDYGGGEEDSGVGLKYIIDGVIDNLIEQEVGENEYHDIAVKKADFDVEKFYEAVHESRLFRKSYQGNTIPIEFVMLRKDVVDKILDEHTIEKYVGDGKGTHGHGKCYINYKFADILKDIPEFLDKIDELLGYTPKDGVITNSHELGETIARMSSYLLRDLRVFDYSHPNLIPKWIGGDQYTMSGILHVNELIVDLMTERRRDEVEAILVDYLKGAFINGFMEATRHNWAPGGHEGSQDDSRDGHNLLANVIIKTLAEEKAAYDAECGEEDTEDEEVSS